MSRRTSPSGPWATLLRVAWLAIALGLLLQLALLLVAAGFGKEVNPGPVLAETFKTVSWSLLVCVGVALGRVAAKGRVPLEGVTGLLAAPLALTVANAIQKGVAEAVDAAGVPAGPAPYGSWPSRPPNTPAWAWPWSGSAAEPGEVPWGTWRSA